MDTATLIESLAGPNAYPFPVDRVEVRQTHISAVFLAGSYVYKFKKPVTFDFVDFSSLSKRRHFCEEEVRLNRRLAPDVYLGVVPITNSTGGPKFEGEGDAIEWAVKMRRLDDDLTLLERLHRGEVGTRLVGELAGRLTTFHEAAESNDRISSFGRFDAVARNFEDVFRQVSLLEQAAASQAILARVQTLAERTLLSNRSLIEARAARGIPRDCHGDLHLDHVYYLPERRAPDNLVIIDCIEFNERLRFSDPIADMAFAAMDFAFVGRRDLARGFVDAYLDAAGDDEARPLVSLYTAYRAAVRGLVDGLLVAEKEVPSVDRERARCRARAHWLLALTELESPRRRPCLVLVAGLPGTGKSVLAAGLANQAGFHVIRSDLVRKELACLPCLEPSPLEVRSQLYSPEMTESTYAECLRRAELLVTEGERVLVDATFQEEKHRQAFLQAAIGLGVPTMIIFCEAKPNTVRARLQARHGDASDADWAVYDEVANNWEEIDAPTRKYARAIVTEDNEEQCVSAAIQWLRADGLEQ